MPSKEPFSEAPLSPPARQKQFQLALILRVFSLGSPRVYSSPNKKEPVLASHFQEDRGPLVLSPDLLGMLSWMLALGLADKCSYSRSRSTEWCGSGGTWNCGQIQEEPILPAPCPHVRGSGPWSLGSCVTQLLYHPPAMTCPPLPGLLLANQRQVPPTRLSLLCITAM